MSTCPQLLESDREFAAILFVRAKDSGTPDAARALENWIDSDDPRRGLIGNMNSFWEAFGSVTNDVRVQTWQEDARSYEKGPRFSFASTKVRLAIAAVVLLAVGLSSSFLLFRTRPITEQQVASAIGERRLVRLADGTRIRLDAASRIAIDYRPDIRIVRLLAGQARFQVAHDPQRPFHVEVAGEDVRALGTDFNVSTTLSTMAVSLIEGSVLLSHLERRPALFGWREEVVRIPTARLEPGQQFERIGRAKPRIRSFDPQLVTAWQGGRLMFRDLPLSDAVFLANRYSRRPIVVDPQLPPIRLTAVVNAGDGVAFAKAISAYIPQSTLHISEAKIEIRKGG